MAKKYSAKLIAKYTEIAKKLEEVFVVSKPEIFFNFRQFLKDESASDCLMTMLIRRGYIERVEQSRFRVMQAHQFQSMARNPVEMLELITDYNTSQKFLRDDKDNRVVPEPRYVDNPFEEEAEVPFVPEPELADKAFKEYLNNVVSSDISIKFDEAHKVLNKLFKDSNAGLIIEGTYTFIRDMFHTHTIRRKLTEEMYPKSLRDATTTLAFDLRELKEKRKENNKDGTEN